MRASFSPGSVNAEKRTVDVVWTTGAKVLRSSWYDGSSYEELSLDPKHVRLDRLNSGAPFLADHYGSTDNVRAVIERAWIENGKGIAAVRFPAEGVSAESDKLFALIRDGIIQNVSVGYRTYRSEKVEGGDEKIPTFRATDWEPYEISAVAMGADPNAHFRSASNQTQNECVFITRGVEMPIDPEVENKRLADLKAATEAAALAATKLERERVSGIRSAVRAAGLGEEFETKLIDGNVSIDKARAEVIDAIAARADETRTDQHLGVEVGETSNEKFVRGASAWLIEKAGQRQLVQDAMTKKIRGFEKVELDGGEFRGMSLFDLCRESLERRGVKTRGMNRYDLVGAALTHRSSGSATTSDFAVLYENVMHKLLLGGYATAPDVWRGFCKVETVQDFRPANRYRVGSFGTMDVVPEGAEYTNKAIPDGQKTTIRTQTKGNIIGLTREAIINDDMSANADLATRFGRGFGLTIESEVFDLLTANSGLGPTQGDSQPFFHANRANVNATGSAITVAGLDADRVVLASQQDISSNEYLNLQPSILLVPIGLGAQARRLNAADYDNDGSKLLQPNIVKGLFKQVIDSPRITGTRRYMFTDPAVSAAIVVAFLEGFGESPTLEQQDGWRRDGVELKARLDFMAQMFDPKGAVTNAGQ